MAYAGGSAFRFSPTMTAPFAGMETGNKGPSCPCGSGKGMFECCMAWYTADKANNSKLKGEPMDLAWRLLKGDGFHPSVTGFRTAARRGFSQPPMDDEATFSEVDDHAERMERPGPERGRYHPEYEAQERKIGNRTNMNNAQRALENAARLKETKAAFEEPDFKHRLESLGF